MPMEMFIIRAGDFIQLKANGEADLASTRERLSSLAAECAARGLNQVLLDGREAPTSLSLLELFELAESFHETGLRPEYRVALLHRKGEGERARFFAMCSANRGWNVRDFDSFERAFEWFSVEERVVKGELGGNGTVQGRGEVGGAVDDGRL